MEYLVLIFKQYKIQFIKTSKIIIILLFPF